jgi:hypothetical protein
MSKKFLNGLSVGSQTFTTSGLSNISNISSTGIIESPYMTPAQIYASTASVTGNISINPSNGSFDGVLTLGSANTTTYLNGNTFIYDSTNSWGANLTLGSLTASRSFAFQNTSGTLALTSGNSSLSANTISGTTASFTATGTFNAVVATTVTATTVNATTVNATTATLTGKLSLATTATNRASVNIPASGTVPTSGNYVIGDMWVSGTSLIFATATNVSKTTMWADLSNAASPTNNSLSLGSGSLTATAVTATSVTATTVTATTVNGTTVQMNSVSATSAATNNALVIRDGSGNFSAGAITASIVYNAQPAPGSVSATGTLLIADMLKGIIVVSGGGGYTLTLPTGSTSDAGVLSGALPNDYSFDWSIINSAGGTVTMAGNTAHTYTGYTGIAISGAIGSYARFRSRKTATNTFITYRIS